MITQYTKPEADKRLVVDLTTLGELKEQDVIVHLDPENFHAVVEFKGKVGLRMTQEQREYLKGRL